MSIRIWNRSISIVTASGLEGRVSVAGRGKRFSLLHNVPTGPGTHAASYSMGSGGSPTRVN
jgi:hypothetical protein